MVSHTNLGGLELSVGAGGLRFKKKPGAYQRCIGGEMKGVTHSSKPKGMGGRYDKDFQASFKSATQKCK